MLYVMFKFLCLICKITMCICSYFTLNNEHQHCGKLEKQLEIQNKELKASIQQREALKNKLKSKCNDPNISKRVLNDSIASLIRQNFELQRDQNKLQDNMKKLGNNYKN